LTYNLRGSLVPHSDIQAARGKLDYLYDLVMAERPQFICLQDLGVSDDVAPALLAGRFARATVRVHGVRTKNSNVAVIVAPGWEVRATYRHGTGRAMAVSVRRGEVELEVVSVYMPPNLDAATGVFSGSWATRSVGGGYRDEEGVAVGEKGGLGNGGLPRRRRGVTSDGAEVDRVRLAEDLYRFILESVERSGGATLVGGDLNNTRCVGDRWSASDDGLALPARTMGPLVPGRLLNEFLGRETVLTDVIRRLRPADGCISTYEGPLRASGDRTRSRLDYILVPTCSCSGRGGGWGQVEIPTTNHSDHTPQMVRFVGALGSSQLHWQHRSWAPAYARVSCATPAEKVRIKEECHKRAGNFLAVWRKDEDGRALRIMLDDFLALMRGGIRRVVPSLKARCTRRRGPPRVSPELRRLRGVREAAEAVLHSVRQVRAGERSAENKLHRRAVGALQDAAGVFAGVRHSDLDGLRGLCIEVGGAGDAHLEEMVAAWRRAPTTSGQRWRHLSASHADPKKIGRFITAYLRPAKVVALDRAVDPKSGKTVWEPEKYKPLVRDIVRAPLSKGAGLRPPFIHEGPGPGPTEIPDMSPPFRSTDAGLRETRASWWDKMYDRGAKGIPDAVFASVCDPPSCAELAAVICDCPGGKAAGHDGLDIDFWKLVASDVGSPCLAVLARLVGMCLRLGIQPDTLKLGWVTMVPKVKPDGSFSASADGMRPITLLPEVGKLASRLLAKRIGEILVRQPHILCTAQRGFLADGSVLQCVDSLVDVIEDWRQKQRDMGPAKAGPLYALSYDQSKAYDSVQAFTIRASLERFNFPEIFIKYVLSGLEGATSRVRTKDGLTAPFDLSSGVRQGDPLSPIIYILTQDALHAGLRDNPLFPSASKEWGYTFSGLDPDLGRAVRTCSSGYADDTAMVATSVESVRQMHAWVREFFGAHRAALNCDKSHLLCSDGAERPVLASVDGLTVIKPEGETHTIRYLGVWLNLQLDWSVHIARMDRLVWSVASSIRRGKFDLVMSKTAINQFLLPGLRIGLLVTDVPEAAVVCWDAKIRSAVLRAADIEMGRNLSVEAFYNALLFPRISAQRWAIRGEELMVTVIAQYPSSSSCRARVATRRAGPTTSRALKTRSELGRRVGAVFASGPRVEPVLQGEHPGPWCAFDKVWTAWTPYLPPRLWSVRGASDGTAEVRVYTDGSTGPMPGLPSGSSVVLVINGEIVRVHEFQCRASGNNYLAEMIALLAALQVVPTNIPLTVHSDCLAGIYSANKRRCRNWRRGTYSCNYALPQRARILSAARPVLNGIRAVIRGRTAPTRLEFVRAHTGASNVHARMNQVADEGANRARCGAGPRNLALRMYGEERHTMSIKRIPVVGAFKPAILRCLAARSVSKWCGIRHRSRPFIGLDLPPLDQEVAHSARLVSAHKTAVLDMSEAVARSRDPQLLRFWVLAVTEQLPVERRLVKCCKAGVPARDHGCKLCGGPVETVRHVFACPHQDLVCERGNSVGGALRSLKLAGVRVYSRAPPPPGQPELVVVAGVDCYVKWVPAWFDPAGGSWIEACVTDSCRTPSESNTDGLAAVLGVMPDAAEEILGRVRSSSGTWRRRSLRETADLIRSLQLTLLRGGLAVWKARCRAADRWWRSPEAEPAVCARAAQCGQARDRDSSRLAQRADKRRTAAYELRMAKKAAKREASAAESGAVSPPMREHDEQPKDLVPGEPHPVDRPGDWLQWKSKTLVVVAGPSAASPAQGLARARAGYMGRAAEVSRSPRVRRQTDHGRDMVPQGEEVAPVPKPRSSKLPWF
jgi:exonuclease III